MSILFVCLFFLSIVADTAGSGHQMLRSRKCLIIDVPKQWQKNKGFKLMSYYSIGMKIMRWLTSFVLHSPVHFQFHVSPIY